MLKTSKQRFLFYFTKVCTDILEFCVTKLQHLSEVCIANGKKVSFSQYIKNIMLFNF